jgi:hypothetical protein
MKRGGGGNRTRDYLPRRWRPKSVQEVSKQVIFGLGKLTIYEGAGSRIRTDDLLIASQSLSFRADISVTAFWPLYDKSSIEQNARRFLSGPVHLAWPPSSLATYGSSGRTSFPSTVFCKDAWEAGDCRIASNKDCKSSKSPLAEMVRSIGLPS